MASDRGRQDGDRGGANEPREPGSAGREGAAPGGVPDFVRRALAAGFSGFFLTGEALREALGDSMPREWADFASEQSTRARSEFIERLSFEMGRAVEGIDWAAVLSTLLEGRTLEVRARIRLGEKDEAGRPSLRVEFED